MTPMADVTQIAALVAAATGFVAAVVGGVNLLLSIRRERPALAVSARHWAADRRGLERYVEVIATNVGHRPVSVVRMGVRLTADGHSWQVDDGSADPPLPAKLEDGEIVVMSWMPEELGSEYYDRRARITSCFVVDGRGREVAGTPPGEKK
jgi:putative intracellular protease/amidase